MAAPAIRREACVFRRARQGDVAAIVSLLADDRLGRRRERLVRPLPLAYRDACKAILADRRCELIVAEICGSIIGCLQLTVMPGLSWQGMTRAHIEDVRVAATLRGRGIGKQLLRHAIKRAKAQGCGMVQLLVNERRVNARHFYARLGFKSNNVGMRLLLD